MKAALLSAYPNTANEDLDAVVAGCERDWRLGHEIALCGRLVKGYGATNERGKDNLLHVLEHLARGPDPAAAARAIALSREAALADEDGKELRFTLVGDDEADVAAGKISWASPLAKAMIGARVGDTVKWRRPAGEADIEIVEIRYPKKQ